VSQAGTGGSAGWVALPPGATRLDPAAVAAVIERNVWGVLTTVEPAGPYAVPVIYGWDGARFHVVSLQGRKATNLDANGATWFTLVEEDGQGGRRVVMGPTTAAWTRGLAARLRSVEVLRRQMKGRRAGSAADAARIAAARFLTLTPRALDGWILPPPA